MKRENHPRLSGKKTTSSHYNHGLSTYEMESLTSIFETFLPSIDLNHSSAADRDKLGLGDDHQPITDAIKAFYKTSGSDRSIPGEAAEIMRKRGLPEAVILVRAVLWLLSTRLGTLLLSGSHCIGKQWPFVTRFSVLPKDKREKVLQSWSKSTYCFFYLRLVFFFMKSLCLYLFLATVDEQSKNPAWEAIDYKPDTTTHLRQNYKHRPLERGVIETLQETPSTLPESISSKGVKLSIHNNHYQIECDVVIIGSGSGGSVAAAILSAAGLKVIVVEKGSYYTALDYSSFERPSMEGMLEQGGMLPSTDGSFMFLAGKVVGGGTAVNWSAALKTPKEVRDEWAGDNYKLGMFGSRSYGEAMDAVCERLGVTEECVKEGFQNRILRKGCENLGLNVYCVPRNSSGEHYCGSCQYGCRSGDKQGADLTWLVDCVEQGGVILTGCKAKRLMIEENWGKKKKKRCVGVVARSLNKNITKEIRITGKVTVTACGALFTPPLMIRSGLRNKHIGRNLKLHPSMMVWGYFPFPPMAVGESSSSSNGEHFEGKMYEGGLITSAHKVKVKEASEESSERVLALVETPALGPGSYAAMCPWESGTDIKRRLLKYSRTANLFTMIRDEGSGEVGKEGRVSYKMTELDKENMRVGLQRAMRILVAAGAEEVGMYRSDGVRIRIPNSNNKEEVVEEFIMGRVEAVEGPLKSEVWGTYCSAHQMGSCRMGVREEDGAVDVNGESWEVEGLYVCDGSILPSAVGVNPMITIQATAYCVAKKLAHTILINKDKDV